MFTKNIEKKKHIMPHIERLSRELFEFTGMDSLIDINSFVVNIGGTIEDYDHSIGKGANAYVVGKKEGFYISIKDADTLSESEFLSLCAQQIGNLFMNMGYCICDEVWDKSDIYLDDVSFRFGHGVEKENAGMLARALLMPKEEYRVASLKYVDPDTGYTLVRDIASHFNTTNEQVYLRDFEIRLT